MADARRFFRYVIPGLTFIIEISIYFWLSNPGKFHNSILTIFSGKDVGIGAFFALFIASGALGFLLGIIYHFLYWLPCVRPCMVDHSPLIKKMMGFGWVELKYCDSCDVEQKEITQAGAWRILTAFWHSRRGSSEIIKGANERIDSLGNTVHGLGTACVGALISYPLWIFIQCYLGNFNPPLSICWSLFFFAAFFYIAILIFHIANYLAIVRDFNSIINIVTTQQIRSEYEKNENTPIMIFISKRDLADKYTCLRRKNER
ncbi:MAG: hypothetical protein WCH07_09335 [Deltaproteobacteria bacterium]